MKKYLQMIIQRPDTQKIKSDFLSLLSDEDNEEYDWEFQFTVNFILREDQYNNAPYETMIQRVNDFFKRN